MISFSRKKYQIFLLKNGFSLIRKCFFCKKNLGQFLNIIIGYLYENFPSVIKASTWHFTRYLIFIDKTRFWPWIARTEWKLTCKNENFSQPRAIVISQMTRVLTLSNTVRVVADSSLVTLIPQKLKNPMETMVPAKTKTLCSYPVFTCN